MYEIFFPMLSQDDPEAEGVVSTWFVSDGDQVQDGDLIAEVAVDKVDMEIHAPKSGVVKIHVNENEPVTQNQKIASID